MAKDGMTNPIQSGESELPTRESRSEQRQRLAHQIGRLLADTWLQRQREAVTDETFGGDLSPDDSAN